MFERGNKLELYHENNIYGGHMLTFEEKLAIIESFPELKRKDVSLKRINFHYEESVQEKKTVVYHLHPNGNGFVYAGRFDHKYPMDDKGMVNIRDFTEDELRNIIRLSIQSLSAKPFDEELWKDKQRNTLTLLYDAELDLWNTYAGELLDGTFPTYQAAANYLEQEGFAKIQ